MVLTEVVFKHTVYLSAGNLIRLQHWHFAQIRGAEVEYGKRHFRFYFWLVCHFLPTRGPLDLSNLS